VILGISEMSAECRAYRRRFITLVFFFQGLVVVVSVAGTDSGWGQHNKLW